jgi:DNA-binding response OmpR family regulator
MRIEPVLATPTAIFRAIKSFYLHEHPTKCSARKTLLLIEAHHPSLASLYPQLELAGYRPIVAGSLAEGIKLSLQYEPDLVMLGVSHQHQKDRDNLRTLLANEATAHKPVLALVTRTDPEEEAFLLGIGFFDLLPLPVNSIRLLARIQNTLRFCCGSRLPRIAAEISSLVTIGSA